MLSNRRKAEDGTAVIDMIEESLQNTNKPSFLRQLSIKGAVLFLMRIVRDALFMALVYTVIMMIYDTLFLFPYVKPLHIDPKPINSKLKYTTFMVSRDRYAYQESAPHFIHKMEPHGASEFILFDIESNPKLVMPTSNERNVTVRLIRKEPPTGANVDGKSFKFSLWESLAFAASNVESDRVFYFDNCNFPSPPFFFDNYLDKSLNYYFHNEARYYTGNFATTR